MELIRYFRLLTLGVIVLIGHSSFSSVQASCITAYGEAISNKHFVLPTRHLKKARTLILESSGASPGKAQVREFFTQITKLYPLKTISFDEVVRVIKRADEMDLFCSPKELLSYSEIKGSFVRILQEVAEEDFFASGPTLQEIISYADAQPDKFKVRNLGYTKGYAKSAQNLIDLYSDIGPVQFSDVIIEGFLSLDPRPTLPQVVQFSNIHSDKYKIRNLVLSRDFIKTPQDFIDLYSNLGAVQFQDTTISLFFDLMPKPTLKQVIAFADLESDRFKVRTAAYEKGYAALPQDFIDLYSNLGPVHFLDIGLAKFSGSSIPPTLEQVLTLANLSNSRSRVFRSAFSFDVVSIAQLEKDIISGLAPDLVDYLNVLAARRDVSLGSERAIGRPGLEIPLDEIGSKLYSVHATNFFPKNGVIKVVHPKNRNEKNVFRPTTHFAIGDMVRPHTNGKWTWDTKAYAVVSPLRDLFPQMLSINTYDSFILGDFALTGDSYIVIPVGSEGLLDRPDLKYYTFDPKSSSLRQAVQELIHYLGGWKVQMYDNRLVVSHAVVDGRNINSADFFAPLFSQFPNISFGAHTYSKFGTGYRIGCVDMFLTELSGIDYGMHLSTIPNYALSLAEFNLKKVDREIIARNDSELSKSIFRDHKAVAESEIAAQTVKYDLAKPDSGGTFRKAFYSATLSPQDLREFALLYSEQFLGMNLELFDFYYAFYRILTIGKSLAEKEGTWSDFISNLRNLENLGQTRNVMETLIFCLLNHLDDLATHEMDALSIVHLPEFESLLLKYLGVDASRIESTKELRELLQSKRNMAYDEGR